MTPGYNLPDNVSASEKDAPWNQIDDGGPDLESKPVNEALENDRWNCAQAQATIRDLHSRLYRLDAPGVYIRRLQAIGKWLEHRGEQIHGAMEKEEMPTLSQLKGIAPDMTGGVSSEEFVRMQRDME